MGGCVWERKKKEKPDPANMYRAVLISGPALDEYQTAALITEGTSLHSESYLRLCCHLDNPLQHQSGRSQTDRLTHKHVCADISVRERLESSPRTLIISGCHGVTLRCHWPLYSTLALIGRFYRRVSGSVVS